MEHKVIQGESSLNMSVGEFIRELEEEGYTVIQACVRNCQCRDCDGDGSDSSHWYHPPVVAEVKR